MYGWPDFKTAAPNTEQLKKGFPQSTVVMATYSNDFKGQKSELFIFLSFFNQSSAVTRKVLLSKVPPVAREFSGSGAFALCFERNCDNSLDRGGRRHFVGARARMTYKP